MSIRSRLRSLHPAVLFCLRALSAGAGGLLLDVASPGVALWPAAFFGVAFILLSLWGSRPWRGFALGLIGGAAFWMPHISWLTLYLGPIPWAALCSVMIIWMGLAGAAIAAITRWYPNARRVRFLRAVPWLRPYIIAIGVAGIWVAREQLQSTWPYGGFPWGRVATLFGSSPFAPVVSWIGFAGLSGAIVFCMALLVTPVAATLGLSPRAVADAPRKRNATLMPFTAAAAGLLALVLVPVFPNPSTGSTTVGAVQGNSDAGIFADRQPGDILRDHIAASEDLVGQSLDFFVWPEAAVDADVPRNMEAAKEIDRIVNAVGAPLVTGIITARNGEYFNSSIVWESDRGIVDQYDKRRPVPFAEYMPNRSFFHALVPDLVNLVQLDYSAGDSSSTVEVAGVTAGVAICFDIIFDELAVDMIDQGAEVVLAQTNNADFGRTDESAQQLAISRLRAIEMGRSIVVISTVGTSAIIGADGKNLASLEPFTADAMTASVPLHSSVTPAISLGWLYAAGLIGAGVLTLFSSVNRRVRGARRAQVRKAARTKTH